MRKGNKRRKKGHSGSRKRWRLIPLTALFLALVWVWKADMVKEYYSKMKNLEDSKKVLEKENSRLSGELSYLKSLTRMHRIVTERFGLTQDVADRLLIEDPVKRRPADERYLLVDREEITDWLERAVFQSGSITAREREAAQEGENK